MKPHSGWNRIWNHPSAERLKHAMSYALFSKGQQISTAFATAAEVWDHADTAGLVEYYEKDGRRRRVLAEHYRVEKVQAPNGAKQPA